MRGKNQSGIPAGARGGFLKLRAGQNTRKKQIVQDPEHHKGMRSTGLRRLDLQKGPPDTQQNVSYERVNSESPPCLSASIDEQIRNWTKNTLFFTRNLGLCRMLCWSSKSPSGQVLGFFLDRSGIEKYRGSGPSKDTAQDREKVGPRTGAQMELEAGQLVNPGVVWESVEMGLAG